ncbi:N-acetylglucosaminyl-phosphatidylinositol de-N-acetylase [Geodia barretti]|uniref:N-acetylglucosaminylphosphatidylinositol deacetylase n=1 Tax=Geodia barretti TaxID=519541 RepID=A0AA35SXA6_GEOBA|nr:N-acetylglucosaminyl-phosphatidylinositol de-N-acetylase [Geodia barretti]
MLLARSNMYLLVLFVLLLLLLVVALSWLRVKTAAGTTLKDLTGRILLITAHPDDECMFFAPTVLSLGSSVRAELFLLCLSEGNYYGEGRVRKKELLHSSAILGISGTNVEIVNDEELADGPREEWSESVIENYIISAVHNCTISRVSGGRGLLHAHCFNKGSVYGYDYFGYNIIERERELGLLLFFSNMGSTIYF